MTRYNAAEVEPRWQKAWAERDIFRARKDKDRAYSYGPCA